MFLYTCFSSESVHRGNDNNANAEKRVNTDFSRCARCSDAALSLSVFFRYISFSRLRFLTQGQKCADLISHLND